MPSSGYGVDWPDGHSRTPAEERDRTTKFSADFRQTQSELSTEMDRLGADRWALEDEKGSGGDPGVVVRWTVDGVDYAVSCDAYTGKRDNLREAYLWIKETRMRSDRPVETGQDSFAAAQLPSGDEDDAIAVGPNGAGGLDEETAAEILGVREDADEDAIRGAAERKLRVEHPDHGGDGDVATIKAARDTLLEGEDA